MIKKAISKVVEGNRLSEKEMYEAFNLIMEGNATNAQIGAFITALRMKNETVDEITGAVRVMRMKASRIDIHGLAENTGAKVGREKEILLDTCGTGGSGKDTINISTIAAFVLAACGIKVAKHGNRSASSRSGSADVLEKLCVNLNISKERVEECIRTVGIGFLFAPHFHGAMKYAIAPRKEIGIRTIFNILGPLSNPAGATRQVLGVYDIKLLPLMAKVLKKLGCKRAMIVHGMDGLDEITISGKTRIAVLKNNTIRQKTVNPKDFGIKKTGLNAVRGGLPEYNASAFIEVLKGKKGPKRDIVLMNASAALVVCDKASSFRQGVKIGARAIDSGKAMQKLNQLIEVTNRV